MKIFLNYKKLSKHFTKVLNLYTKKELSNWLVKEKLLEKLDKNLTKMKYLITYEDALKLVKAYKDFNFSKTEYMLSGYKVVTFSYFLCEFKHFDIPLRESPNVKGYDMRGVTFVFNKDGSLFKRFFMLSKFFNLDQVENTQYNVVKNKKIKSITEKEDGSLIAFMYLPDDTIFAKTIGSFNNEQSVGAMKILNKNDKLKTFISAMLHTGYTPLFEYVSWDNRIVLKYSKPELRLIGIRNNRTGEFIPGFKVENPKCQVAKKVTNVTLDDLIKKSKIEENKEGWVIEFEDGQMIKIKTHWYIVKHKCRDNLDRENIVIEMILNETIDDVISEFNEPMFTEKIEYIQNILNNYVINKILEIEKLCKKYKGDRKEFAIKYNKDKNFHLAIQTIINEKNIKSVVVDYLLKRTKYLKKAREFIEKGAI